MYLLALFYLKAIITAYLPNPLQLGCSHSYFHILMLSVDEMQLWLRPVIQTMVLTCLLSQPCRNIQSCILYSVHERCCLSLYAVICCWWLKNRNWILLPNWFWQPCWSGIFFMSFLLIFGNNKYEKMVTKRKTFICYSGYKCAVTIMCNYFLVVCKITYWNWYIIHLSRWLNFNWWVNIPIWNCRQLGWGLP